MSSYEPLYRRRDVRLYILGQAAIVIGACGMDWTGSTFPMALGTSAALMLSMPLVTNLARRAVARRAAK